MAERNSTAIAIVLAALIVAAGLGFLALSIRQENPAKQAQETVATAKKERALAQIEATLKNAATAEESFATGNQGTYTSEVSDLIGQGLALPNEVSLTPYADASGYCIEATHSYVSGTWRLSSDIGSPENDGC